MAAKNNKPMQLATINQRQGSQKTQLDTRMRTASKMMCAMMTIMMLMMVMVMMV